MGQTRYVALLRGINLGGKNKLPMKELVALFDAAGCDDVVTYIQSGNVVFTASAATVKSLPDDIAAAIHKGHGLKVPVVLRSAAELDKVVKGNPFLKRGADAGHCHVAFLAAAPTRAQVAALDPQRSPGDDFVVAGRDVYLHLPNGVARSKLTNAWLDTKLKTVSTARNWRTVLKVLELAAR